MEHEKMKMKKFDFTIAEKSNHWVVDLKGRMMDTESIKELISQVEEALKTHNKIILNLEQLEYLNSSGLNTLISILTKSRVKGGETIITNVPESVNKLFIISKLNTVFEIKNSVEEAEQELLTIA